MADANIQARKKHVILTAPDDGTITTKGGILIGSQFSKSNGYGVTSVVVSVGEECKDLEDGDKVLWNYHDATPFPMGTETFYSLREELVMAVINTA